MIDHAPRIRAQQQAAKEDAIMADLEKRAAPLHYALLLVVIALALGGAFHQGRAFVQHYIDMAAENEAMVQCLNGHIINVDDVLVSCNTHTSALVAEVTP